MSKVLTSRVVYNEQDLLDQLMTANIASLTAQEHLEDLSRVLDLLDGTAFIQVQHSIASSVRELSDLLNGASRATDSKYEHKIRGHYAQK